MSDEHLEYEENEQFRAEMEWQQYLDEVAALNCGRCGANAVAYDTWHRSDVPGDSWYGLRIRYVRCTACGHVFPFDPTAP